MCKMCSGKVDENYTTEFRLERQVIIQYCKRRMFFYRDDDKEFERNLK